MRAPRERDDEPTSRVIAFTDETPRLERVTVTAKPICPKCGATYFDCVPWSGTAELRCRKRACDQRCLVIALPRSATGNTLRGLFGDAGAATIVRLVVPAFRDCEIPEALWSVPVTGAEYQAYVAIPLSPRQLHHWRWQPVERIARALHLV